MKRRSFVVLAFAAFLASGFAGASAQSSGAVDVVHSFYDWLMGNQQNWTDLSGAEQYFTPSLYASVKKAVGKEQSEKVEIFEANPFVDSQIEADSYSIGGPSGKGTTATVPVTFHFPNSKQVGTVRVVLVHNSVGWKIDNFTYPGGGSLRNTLQNALK
jgi:hypothetical protein